MPAIQAPIGTFDVLPEDGERRAQLTAQAQRVLGAAGYRQIETPTFEATELFARAVGGATDIVQKEMYSFDDGGGRSLTLRPEGTAPICRSYVAHGMHKLPQPVKLWYLCTFFRAEKPQRGRYRQFWQVGAEAIGSDAPETDAELIVLLADLLDALSVRELTLHLGSLGSPETRAAYREELTSYLRTHETQLSAEVRARIDLNPMRAFDSSDPATRAVMGDAPKLMDRLAPEDADHFAQVRRLLDDAGIAYVLDPTLVRGLDYYTRTLFEFSSSALGSQSGVGGGGRYDGLVEQLGGKHTPAAGWAAGVERILLAADELRVASPVVDLFVALGDAQPTTARAAFELTLRARRAGLSAQLELAGRSLKGQFKQADRLAARYVATVTDDAPTVLRNRESSEQIELPLDAVIATVLRGNRI